MGKMHLNIPDDIDRRFRVRVLELRGVAKGVLSEAVAEALELWIEEHPGKA